MILLMQKCIHALTFTMMPFTGKTIRYMLMLTLYADGRYIQTTLSEGRKSWVSWQSNNVQKGDIWQSISKANVIEWGIQESTFLSLYFILKAWSESLKAIYATSHRVEDHIEWCITNLKRMPLQSEGSNMHLKDWMKLMHEMKAILACI